MKIGAKLLEAHDALRALEANLEGRSKVDYGTLLAKYVEHVRQCEGIDFLDRLNDSGWPGSDVVFTDDELAALKPLARPL